MDTLDIALRLSAASIVGVMLGLNRDLHGKPTGVRTPWRPVPRLGFGRSVDPRSNGLRRQSCDPRRRDGRRFSGRGRHCPKRETSSRAGAHDRGMRLGNRVHGCRLRDRAVADRGDRRCSDLVILVFGGRFEKAVDRRWLARRMEVADRPPDTPE
jgi:hypothetical protein